MRQSARKGIDSVERVLRSRLIVETMSSGLGCVAGRDRDAESKRNSSHSSTDNLE